MDDSPLPALSASRRPAWRALLSALLPLALAYALWRWVDWRAFAAQLRGADPVFAGLAVLSLALGYLFRVWRLRLILGLGSPRVLFGISTTHYFLNRVLPARSGEVTLPLLLRQHLGVPVEKGVAALLFFRLLDLFALLLFWAAGFAYLPAGAPLSPLWGLAALAGAVGLALLWWRLDRWAALAGRLAGRLFPERLAGAKAKSLEVLGKLARYKAGRPSGFLPRLLAASLLNWLATYLYYHFLLVALSFGLSFGAMLFAVTISNLTFLLPVSAVGNLGSFETGWAAGFHLVGISLSASVPAGLLANLLATAVTALLALAGWLLLRRPAC